MAGLTSTNIVLSDFGTRVFLIGANTAFTDTPAALTDPIELLDITGIENLGFSRESQGYQVLSTGGWEKKALLGFTTDDMSVSMVRTEQGAYNEDSTYWTIYNKLNQFKVNKAFFDLVIVRPVAALATEDAYEAVKWTCFCTGIEDSATNDSGREYTATFARSGEPTNLVVSINNSAAAGEVPYLFATQATA